MLAKIHIPVSGTHVTFVLPMPAGWSKKKKDIFNDCYHSHTPDLDNLIKALLDALFENDSEVWDLHATKIWGRKGKIIVE
jgi:Holliday junction resolvase RusA-like endonuclease